VSSIEEGALQRQKLVTVYDTSIAGFESPWGNGFELFFPPSLASISILQFVIVSQ
jgi:hypothetical protein